MATCVFLNSESYNLVCSKVHRLSRLIELYRWIIDAYVSDFYTLQHWEKLPKCVQEYFDGCSPSELCWLLTTDEKQLHVHQERVAPLCLLALQCSLEALSLRRTAVDVTSEEAVNGICNVLNKTDREAAADKEGDKSELPNSKHFDIKSKPSRAPQYKNGQNMDMKHIFRKHVKPKKQHEIQKLGQTISLLAETANCSHVVDVGAGLGHLSRLLSFQHGLHVTTVEAADGHAPKAATFDREMKKEIHKALLKRKAENLAEGPVTEVSDEPGQHGKKSGSPDDEPKSGNLQSSSDTPLRDHERMVGLEREATPDQSERLMESPVETGATAEEDTSLPHHLVCLIQPDIAASQFMEILSTRTQKVNAEGSQEAWGPQFVLAGLHACGDLTPTLLRVFTECPTAVGLASVACCYMKIAATSCPADESSNGPPSSLDNYPMSSVLKAIPHHHLTYEAREMACHFADAYRDRLEKSPPHLKIHSYRAAFQYLITRVMPDFKSGQARFVSKKGAEGTFTQYAKDNLKKVGVDFSTVPPELLHECESMASKWMPVVGFYTLRLSLAPAVETLLLLDRMLFLFEKGIPSVLVPIFDSSISPRNFALLAVKPKGNTEMYCS
ncbi:protein RRNAD1 [Aplysia californica]|uniref:Protein RRNAD1 n=1 Tax=Aplysia californica TaxID=6500 RepID=A0ABM0JN17_APLCA|nr:protein RRNAD1 [Aplysia californica]